jgi:NAD(P)-dependent dehydrogenase (short-subunit alcohol dehydrogenase family)
MDDGRINTRTVVLGASGGIGRAVVAELVAAGHPVVAVARDADKLAGLAQHVTQHVSNNAELTLLPGSVASEEAAARLARELVGLRQPIAAVVATLRGPCSSARLLDQPVSYLKKKLAETLLSHFIAAKHLMPMLIESRPGGLYLMIGGPATSYAWAGYGHVSITEAATQMLALVLREEAKELALRVQQLEIATPVRTADNAACACPEWLDAADVGRHVVALVEGRGGNEPIVRIGAPRRPRRPESSHTQEPIESGTP